MSLQLDPATVIERGEVWTLALNRNQNLLGKTMIVLHRPCTAVVEVDPAEWLALQAEIRRVAGALRSLFEPDQFNFAFLMNLDAQVHLHVVPRYASLRRWSGRAFTDPDWGGPFGNAQHLLGANELAALASEVRSVLPEATSTT